MSILGHQEFWVAGTRAYFKRDDLTVDEVTTQYPWMDLGVINPVNPALTPTKIQLKDSDGGKKRIVAEALPEIEEKHAITCSNLNLDMLALMFISTPPEAFDQNADVKEVSHHAFPGRLIKIHDSDADETLLYRIAAVSGVYVRDAVGDLTNSAFTAIVKSTKTITATGDLSALLSPGDLVIVRGTGLANILNAGTYTVVSATFGATTAIVVEEDFAANETAITGSLTYVGAGDTGVIYAPGIDWEVVSLDRGLIRMIDGGALVAEDELMIDFTLVAFDGNLLFKPQSLTTPVNGTMILVWGRDDNAEQTVRECRVSMVATSSNITADDFSNFVLEATVITNLDATDLAGRMLQIKGTLPSAS